MKASLLISQEKLYFSEFLDMYSAVLVGGAHVLAVHRITPLLLEGTLVFAFAMRVLIQIL